MLDKAKKDHEIIQQIIRLINECDFTSTVTLTLVDIAALLNSIGYVIRDFDNDVQEGVRSP